MTTGAGLALEATLWAAAEKLRSRLDAAAYKHVVLGLLFLKHLSDRFEEVHEALQRAGRPRRPAAYRELGASWIPQAARWNALRAAADAPDLGARVDAAMAAIERHNPKLRGVLPQGYARLALGPRLGELLDLVSGIGMGGGEGRSRDILGRVYEYFLAQFAAAEGRRGGEFYTPRCLVRLLVEMLAPRRGSIFDPCCGSGGMFVQSERFLEARGGRAGALRFHGQELNPTTWRLCRMNLALRGVPGELGGAPGDSLHDDKHPDLEADYVLANPPFNDSDWGGERLQDDPRWQFGVPPPRNANFAWIQHFIHHLGPRGQAAFIMANGSMSSINAGEGEIRRRIVEADLVDCIVALPPQLFYATQIPVCIWILARGKRDRRFRDRRGETLFIDARGFGTATSRVQAELREDEIERLAALYQAYRGDPGAARYADVPGLCRAATLEDIRRHRFALVPGRYVGVARSPAPAWDRDELAHRIEEIEERALGSQSAMVTAIRILRELIRG